MYNEFKYDNGLYKNFVVCKVEDATLELTLNQALEEGYELVHICTYKTKNSYDFEINHHVLVFKKIKEK